MVQQRLQHWIEHPEELSTESLYELRQLLVQYPFFQTARILYLKNLYLLRDPSFKDELRKGALFVADLSILFYAIEGDKFVINRHVAEKENVSSETSDRTLDLIDRFLADDKDLSVEKLFPLPVEAVDYTSVLMEKEENTETASVNPLRGQDLIDHFIFSQRLTFLENRKEDYLDASTYEKLFGIGYLEFGQEEKAVEMDYFDIYYSHGVVGFIIYFAIYGYIFYLIMKKREKLNIEKYCIYISIILIILLSFITGHIITAPSVSILVAIILLKVMPDKLRKAIKIKKKEKKGILTIKNMLNEV